MLGGAFTIRESGSDKGMGEGECKVYWGMGKGMLGVV